MDKSRFGEGNDLVSSLPKDWLNLRPPSSSFTPLDLALALGDVGYPVDFQDTQNLLASSGTQDGYGYGYGYPPSTPLIMSGDSSHMPFSYQPFENSILQNDPSFVWPCPPVRQDFLKTTLSSPLDDTLGNIKKNALLDEDRADCFHMLQRPEVTETSDNLPFEGIFGLTLCTGNNNSNNNICFSGQGPKLSSKVSVQGTSESSMMVSGADHLYGRFTHPSCMNFTNCQDQDFFEANSKVPHNQLEASIQFSVSSSEGTADDLCGPVEDDFSLTDDSFFPVGDSLAGDCFLRRSKVSSYPLCGNIGTVSIPQVTESLIGGENICLQGKDDFLPWKLHGTTNHDECTQSASVGWLSQRNIDEKVGKASNPGVDYDLCTGFGYSQKLHTLEKNGADYMSDARKFMATQSSAENSKHRLMNPEPKKCGSDHLDSVMDCHTLIENIQNSSFMLVASHSSESDRLQEPDVEALLSVIHNLSKYLTHRSGISSSFIQAASQLDKVHFGGSSSIGQKISKLAECYYRENDAADYEMQVSKLSDICSASRDIHIAEVGQNMTDIFAESDQLPGTYYKNMGKLSDLDQERESKRALSELQDLVEKLREEFEFKLKERDTGVLYKNLWSETHAALSTIKSEMEKIKTEVEELKKTQFHTDAHVLDVRGGETHLEINLNPKENVMDEAAKYQGKDHEEPDMNTHLISQTDIMSKVLDERAFWERAAVLLSREESLRERETFDIKDKTSSKCPVEVDLNPKRNVTDQAAVLPACRKDRGESQTKTNLNSLIIDTSQVHCEDSFWERAALLSSLEESLGKSDISSNEYNSDHDTLEVSPEIDTMQREEIISRFKVLQEYKQSDMVARCSGKQIGEAVFDELGSWNNSLHLEEIVADESNPEICESSQVQNQAIQGGRTFWERASLLLSQEKSLRETETSEVRGGASSECSLKVDLNSKVNVTDRAAILPSHRNICENPETKKNLNCLMNVTPQAHDEVSIRKSAAVLFSQEERHGESDRYSNLTTFDHDRTKREEILCRFNVLQKCSHHSDMTGRDSKKQFNEANAHEAGSCSYSHLEENVVDDLNSECCKSNQGHNQATQGGRLASQNVYPDADEVQAHLAVLYCTEASGGEVEDNQTIVMSNNFEKQASCSLASEDIHDIVNSTYGTEYFSISHLGLKSPMTFGTEQLLCIVPATESSFEQNALIRNLSMISQLESFSSVPVPDVSIGSQSIYFDHEIEPENSKCDSNLGELSNVFFTTEYSCTPRKWHNAFKMDDPSQIFFATSLSIPKLDSDKRDIIGMQNQNCSNPSRDSADAEYLNQEELGCISQCQHDIGQDNFSSQVESSSTYSESSWEYIEQEEDIAFQC